MQTVYESNDKSESRAENRQKVTGRGRPKDSNAQQINKNSESFRNFIRRFRNSPKTKLPIGLRFVAYCNLPNVRAKIKVDVGDNTDLLLFDDSRKIQNIIKHFIDYQYEVKGLSPATKSYYVVVKHFYESNEVILNWSIVRAF